MPALDLAMIDQLGRDLHPPHTGLMTEDEVCPWTLFLTMALTLLKGVLPHVPRMLPVLVQDPELRERAIETFMSEEFNNNIEEYFVQNIKVRLFFLPSYTFFTGWIKMAKFRRRFMHNVARSCILHQRQTGGAPFCPAIKL